MSDKPEEPAKTFHVSASDCERWLRRFHKMAKSLEGKEKQEDGIRMFYTAAVLLQQFRSEIEHDAMMRDAEHQNPFGVKTGEA